MAKIKVIAGVDFSDCSANAVDYIVQVSKYEGLDLTLVYCYSEYIDINEFDQEFNKSTLEDKKVVIKKAYNEKLNDLKKHVEALLNQDELEKCVIKTVLLHGYPDDKLTKFIKEKEPNLVVLGTPTKMNSITELMGTVTSDVIRKISNPVLAVPILAEKHIQNNKNLLFVTDYKQSDFNSIHRLLKILSNQDIKIFCVHFCHSKPDKYDEMRRENLQKYVNETYRNNQFYCELIVGDDFVKSINNFIEANNIGVIALTRVKRNIISNMFHPNITRELLFNANIPIIVFNE